MATKPTDTAAGRYDARAIERKWQELWEREGTWEVPNPGEPGFDPDVPESYVLEMLPYPSGEPHIGHLKNYSMGDALAHYRRRNGMRVLHPMGYDAFGLPAENHAIKTGEHPARVDRHARSRSSGASSAPGASRSTGGASSAPTSRRTTAGPSGSS